MRPQMRDNKLTRTLILLKMMANNVNLQQTEVYDNVKVISLVKYRNNREQR